MPDESRRARRDRIVRKQLDTLADAIKDMRTILDDPVNSFRLVTRAVLFMESAANFAITIQEIQLSPYYPTFPRLCRKIRRRGKQASSSPATRK